LPNELCDFPVNIRVSVTVPALCPQIVTLLGSPLGGSEVDVNVLWYSTYPNLWICENKYMRFAVLPECARVAHILINPT
jgi:hypothetical protein